MRKKQISILIVILIVVIVAAIFIAQKFDSNTTSNPKTDEVEDTTQKEDKEKEDRPDSTTYINKVLDSYDQLPLLRLDTFAGGASSYDRSGGNYDGFDKGNFLYEDEHGDKVMLDVKGPGTVHRMWFTAFNEFNSYIKIYFDGEEEPSINMRLKDVFTGDTAPFLAPLVHHNFLSSGGFVSNVPLNFNKSIKITTNGVGVHNFYNIGYHLYAPGTEVKTWDGTEDVEKMNDIWNKIWNGQPANFHQDQEIVEETITLEAQSKLEVASLEGSRMIDWLTLKIPGIEPSQIAGKKSEVNVEHLLQGIRLQAYWDGEEEPSVDAPIGPLFSMGMFEVYETRSIYAGMGSDGEMYLNIPMPFEKSGKIVLVNDSEETIDGVSFKLAHREFAESFSDVGYFKTQMNHQFAKAGDGKDLLILEEEGAGHFIGVVQSVRVELGQSSIEDRWHLEGDERIYIDHSETPVIQGTGTEDFYNGAWYFGYGEFSTQLAGYTSVKVENNVESSSYYRFFMADAIPFRSHIKASIEHGAANDISSENWLLAFYYHQPEPRMTMTDELDIGDTTSEEEHNYTISGETWTGKLTHTYEGNFAEEVEDEGRSHNGFSEFTMRIAPENKGVVLRRRFDQILPNQLAEVYVNGEQVGPWYHAGSNITHAWRDLDFFIPEEFTSGKEEITIKVEYVKTEADDWSEFRYQAFTLN
nr:glycoside hydrolase family 172 protein [Paenibacillus bovis]